MAFVLFFIYSVEIVSFISEHRVSTYFSISLNDHINNFKHGRWEPEKQGSGANLNYLQGYQLNMAMFFWHLEKVTCPVYICTVAYTWQVTFYKVPEKHDHV